MISRGYSKAAWIGLLLLAVGCAQAWGQALDRRYLNVKDALDYGDTCTATTLQAALSAIGTDKVTLLIPRTDVNRTNCVWNLTTNVVVPRNVALWIPSGVKVNVSAGMVLTVGGPLLADDDNWYTGTVHFLYKAWGTAPSYADIASAAVISGCYHDTSLTTLVDMVACEARSNDGVHFLQEVASITYPTSSAGRYWLIGHKDTDSTVTGWTRQANTHYLYQKSATEPAVPTGAILLGDVTVSATAVTKFAPRGPKASLWKGSGLRWVNVADYGALHGSIDQDKGPAITASCLDLSTVPMAGSASALAAGDSTVQNVWVFPATGYTIASSINCDIPANTKLIWLGASFNGVAANIDIFNLNPNANATNSDTAGTVKRDVEILGGSFTNGAFDGTNQPTGGAAVRMYSFRNALVEHLHCEKFYQCIAFAGKDEWKFRGLRMNDNVYGLDNVEWDLSTEGNQEIHITDSTFGTNSATAVVEQCGVCLRAEYRNVWIEHNSFAAGTGGAVLATLYFDNTLFGSAKTMRHITVIDNHFEGGAGSGGNVNDLWFRDLSAGSSLGFYKNVTLARNTFAGQGATAMRLEHLQHSRIEHNYFTQSVAAGGHSILLDATSDDVRIDCDNVFRQASDLPAALPELADDTKVVGTGGGYGGNLSAGTVSANTLTLPDVCSTFFGVSTATRIDKIVGGCWPGREISLGLANGQTFGAPNIPEQVNDVRLSAPLTANATTVLGLVCGGTNVWEERFRSLNSRSEVVLTLANDSVGGTLPTGTFDTGAAQAYAICNDPDGCNFVFADPTATDGATPTPNPLSPSWIGQQLTIICLGTTVAANACNFANQTNILTLTGGTAPGVSHMRVNDVMVLTVVAVPSILTKQYREVSRTNPL